MAACVTIGNFDGVHLGHQALVGRAAEQAARRGLECVAVTFWPHPRTVLRASLPHRPLSTREEREGLLRLFGADRVLELVFDEEMAAMSPARFIHVHLKPLGLEHMVVGHDFSLGRGASGNFAHLQSVAAQEGFSVERIEALNVDGSPASSTRLRDFLDAGNVADAARLLGRPYALEGPVVSGFGRGRGIGFPTANMKPPAKMLPANGVYAARAAIGGKTYPAVTNIGRRPTFDDGPVSVESFLLGAAGDLYGQTLGLEFIEYLRPERRFENAGELAAQIASDAERAREIYTGRHERAKGADAGATRRTSVTSRA